MLEIVLAMLFMPMAQQAPAVDPDTLDKKVYNDVYIVYNKEYDKLYNDCGASKCCRSSVRVMRERNADPNYAGLDAKNVCPKGLERKTINCPNSYVWCEKPRPGESGVIRPNRGSKGKVIER